MGKSTTRADVLKLYSIVLFLSFLLLVTLASGPSQALSMDTFSYSQPFLASGKSQFRVHLSHQRDFENKQFFKKITWQEVFKSLQLNKNQQQFYDKNNLSPQSSAGVYSLSLKERDLVFQMEAYHGLTQFWEVGLLLPMAYRMREVEEKTSYSQLLVKELRESGRMGEMSKLGKHTLDNHRAQFKYAEPDAVYGLYLPEVVLRSRYCFACRGKNKWSLLNTLSLPLEPSYRASDIFTLTYYKEDFVDLGLGVQYHRRLSKAFKGYMFVNYQAYLREGRPVRFIHRESEIVDIGGEVDPGDVIARAIGLYHRLSSSWNLNYSLLREEKLSDRFYARKNSNELEEVLEFVGHIKDRASLALSYQHQFRDGLKVEKLITGLEYHYSRLAELSFAQTNLNISYIY